MPSYQETYENMTRAYTKTGLKFAMCLPLYEGEGTALNAIKKVIFNGPATIVIWYDGTKTVVKCSDMDIYDPEKGLAMAICKYVFGNEGKFKRVFRKWLPEEDAGDELRGTPLGDLGSIIRKIFSPDTEA